MSMRAAIAHLTPQIVLVVGAAVTLVVALLVPRHHQRRNASLAVVVLGISAVAQLDLLDDEPTLTFDALWALDSATSLAALIVLAATAVVVVITPEWMHTDRRHGEYYTMLLLGALGSVAMAGANDLNLLVVGVTLSSITGYTLAAYHRRSPLSVEAGIKYFLVGAFANLVLMVGVVLAFSAGGTTHYVDLGTRLAGADPWLAVPAMAAVVVGLTFKIGAVPAHSWVPDVAQGAPAPSAAFLTVVPKIGGAVALIRLVDLLPDDVSGWRPTVAVASALTMTFGNLVALRQDDVRRLLGWSSVSQAGYALMAVAAAGASDLAVPSLLMFLAAYAIANLAAFATVTALRGRTRLADYAGLATHRPWLTAVLVVSLLSLVGIPPLAGFAGKLAVFAATIDAGLGWLALVAVLNTVLSLAYYVRVIAPAVLGATDTPILTLGRWSTSGASVAGTAVVVIGLGAGIFLHWTGGPLLP